MQKNWVSLGLMSGTSGDGVDASIIKTNGIDRYELIKNKYFTNSLINNVSNILSLINKKKSNSIIINYDQQSSDLFYWYQQLVAESLGKI